MNQHAPEPSFELPPLPSQEAASVPVQAHEASVARETTPALPQAPLAAPLQPVASIPLQPPVAMPQSTPVATSSAPLSADDSDLIEKEWVLKAKQIVAATRDDPHAQNRELSRVKADYLKKRYGKDIKVDES